jgi:hypothetical protein
LLTVYLLLALTILQNMLFYSDMRFRAPIEPMLILLAGGAIYKLALMFAPKFVADSSLRSEPALERSEESVPHR